MLAYRAYLKKLTLSQITVQPNVHITYILKKTKTCQGCKRKRKKIFIGSECKIQLKLQ